MRKLAALFSVPSLILLGFPLSGAQASTGLCLAQYDEDLRRCQGSEPCENHATMKFQDCLDRLEETNQ